jgi:hypothetical protein
VFVVVLALTVPKVIPDPFKRRLQVGRRGGPGRRHSTIVAVTHRHARARPLIPYDAMTLLALHEVRQRLVILDLGGASREYFLFLGGPGRRPTGTFYVVRHNVTYLHVARIAAVPALQRQDLPRIPPFGALEGVCNSRKAQRRPLIG